MLPHVTTDSSTPKLCECGCGQPAPIAKETRRRNGVLLSVKGEPRRFIPGHNSRRSDEQRFWQKIDKHGPNGCWLWQGMRASQGYGRAFWNGKSVVAHRLSYELNCGPIPEGMFVCHHCDNPQCVNPAHLFVGTPADNMRDMHEKGRAAIEAKHGMAKISETDIPVIRRLSAEGMSYSELGRRYGVVYTTIRDIVQRKTWKHASNN